MLNSTQSTKVGTKSKFMSGRALRMEAMEERRMMAGDVTVDVVNYELDIDGDASGNAVQVSKLSDGNLEVRGLYKDGSLTKINGSYSPLTVASNMVSSMDIDMGDGDDDLYLNAQGGYSSYSNKMQLTGDLDIRMQGGDDFVKIQNMVVRGVTDISTDRETDGPMYVGHDYAGGNDTIEVKSSSLGELSINSGGGNDAVSFETNSDYRGNPDWNVVSQTNIRTGSGDDDVSMRNLFSANQMIVQTGLGDDNIEVDNSVAYRDYMLFSTGAGSDHVKLSNINLYWNNQTSTYARSPDTDLYVFTGSGNDVVEMDNVNVQTGDVYIDTGSGNDTVDLDDVDVRDMLFADVGSGVDNLFITRSSAAVAELYGGTHTNRGRDYLRVTYSSFGQMVRNGFERGFVS